MDNLNKKNTGDNDAPFSAGGNDFGKSGASMHTMKDDLDTIKEGGELAPASEAASSVADLSETTGSDASEVPSPSPFLGQAPQADVDEELKDVLDQEKEVVEEKEVDLAPVAAPVTDEVSEPVEEAPTVSPEPAIQEGPKFEEAAPGKFVGAFGDDLKEEEEKEIAGPEIPTPEVPTPEAPISLESTAPAGAPFEAAEGAPEDATEQFEPDSSVNWRKVFVGVFVFVVVIGLLGGGYYFYFMKAPEAPEQIVVEEVVEEEAEVEVVEEVFDYSLTMPNYLNIDAENASLEMISGKVVEIFSKFPEGETGPFEFVLADNNFADMGVGKFSEIVGLSLSDDVLGNLKDNFSLFLFDDQGMDRVAISIEFDEDNKSDLKSALLNSENSLPEAIPDFFALGVGNVSEEVSFSDSNYMGVGIRYLNVDLDNRLAIDYALVDKYLIIATSKDSMRSIINRVLSGQDNGDTITADEEDDEMSEESESEEE
jgi:hypothetical protein